MTPRMVRFRAAGVLIATVGVLWLAGCQTADGERWAKADLGKQPSTLEQSRTQIVDHPLRATALHLEGRSSGSGRLAAATEYVVVRPHFRPPARPGGQASGRLDPTVPDRLEAALAAWERNCAGRQALTDSERRPLVLFSGKTASDELAGGCAPRGLSQSSNRRDR